MTLGLAHRVAQDFHNWCSVAPYRQILSNSVNIDGRLDRRQLIYTGKHLSQILLLLQWVLSLTFVAARQQKVLDLQHDNIHLKSEHFPH